MFSTTKLCRISEKPKNINKQQMIHEAESLDSAFPPYAPTAHSMHAPTLYWSTELLCYCAPFPEVNISETSEMLCRYEAWTHSQIESDVTGTHKEKRNRCHCGCADVAVNIMPVNIASSKRKNINNSFFSSLLLRWRWFERRLTYFCRTSTIFLLPSSTWFHSYEEEQEEKVFPWTFCKSFLFSFDFESSCSLETIPERG